MSFVSCATCNILLKEHSCTDQLNFTDSDGEGAGVVPSQQLNAVYRGTCILTVCRSDVHLPICVVDIIAFDSHHTRLFTVVHRKRIASTTQTSAKTYENVNEAFTRAAKMALERIPVDEPYVFLAYRNQSNTHSYYMLY